MAGKTVTGSKTKISCDGTGCLRGRKNPGNIEILRRPAHRTLEQPADAESSQNQSGSFHFNGSQRIGACQKMERTPVPLAKCALSAFSNASHRPGAGSRKRIYCGGLQCRGTKGAGLAGWRALEKSALCPGRRSLLCQRQPDVPCPGGKGGAEFPSAPKRKIAELALGYGGSVQALKKMMGTAASEIPEKELSDMVSAWRRANPHITAFWRQVNRAAKQAIRFHDMGEAHGIRFYYDYGFLCIQLPSGRKLVYADPRVETDPLGWDHITFLSGDEWKRQETYGARLVENMVQGIARDLLAHAMRNLSSSSIVLHVHDEIVVEEKGLPPEEVCKQMCRLPDWARGLLLTAEGSVAPFYCK